MSDGCYFHCTISITSFVEFEESYTLISFLGSSLPVLFSSTVVALAIVFLMFD